MRIIMKLRKLETLCINSLNKYNICKFKFKKCTKDDCIIYNASKEIQYAAHNMKNIEKYGISTLRKNFKKLEPLLRAYEEDI